MDNPIITTLLDNDLYKWTMMQAAYNQYPLARVSYEFFCRDNDANFGFLADEVREQIEHLRYLVLKKAEADYLKSLYFMDNSFIDDMVGTSPMKNAFFGVHNDNGKLKIHVEGLWWNAILYEVPVLAIVNELAFDNVSETLDTLEKYQWEDAREKFLRKLEFVRNYPTMTYVDFGTRRRFSKSFHDFTVGMQTEKCPNFVGTSNLMLARKYGIKAIGTVAHEWQMAHLGLADRISQAQKRALHVWQQEFGEALGIALSDTFTSDAFFRDFDGVLSRAYDGVRHDSGCPFEFGEKAITHYENLNIDPRQKTVVFSDGLNFDSMFDVWKHFVGRIHVTFGVGTFLTGAGNFDLKPLNIVMKITSCDGTPCIKLSDVPGKVMGEPIMVQRVQQAYNVDKG